LASGTSSSATSTCGFEVIGRCISVVMGYLFWFHPIGDSPGRTCISQQLPKGGQVLMNPLQCADIVSRLIIRNLFGVRSLLVTEVEK
jgi:hypothetical protein